MSNINVFHYDNYCLQIIGRPMTRDCVSYLLDMLDISNQLNTAKCLTSGRNRNVLLSKFFMNLAVYINITVIFHYSWIIFLELTLWKINIGVLIEIAKTNNCGKTLWSSKWYLFVKRGFWHSTININARFLNSYLLYRSYEKLAH